MDFKKHLLEQGFSNSTTQTYYRDTLCFISWLEAERVEPESCNHNDLVAYVKHLRKNKKPRTVQLEINSIKHFLGWLIIRELREDNPAQNINIKGIIRKQLYHIIKPQELDQLFSQFINQEIQVNELIQQRNKALLGMIIYQGLPTTDLQNLTLANLNLREGTVFISSTRKSNERTLQLQAFQIMDLMEYTLARTKLLELTQKETDSLFITLGKGKNSLYAALKKLVDQLRKINPKVSSLKQIRTSVITHWLKKENLRKTQYMAGHKYISSTEAYLVNDIEGLQENINRFHPISE